MSAQLRRMLRRFALAAVSALIFATSEAHAQSDGQNAASRPWFAYGTPEEKHYARAALEVSAFFALGELQYQSETTNSTDWDLDYDWPSFRKKLTGDAVRFDTNRFDTNMITHPSAGLGYYVIARGNRLNVLESFLYATAASTMWEYVGEIKEKVSINDLIVTPIAGAAAGEVLFELGVFFERSKKTPVTTGLAWLLAPSKELHDVIDGATPYRSSHRDAIGLTEDIAHRFELEAGAGMTTQGASPAREDARFALRTHLANVAHYDAPGHDARLLSDANVSYLDVEATLGREALEDFELQALIAPVGFYAKDLRRDARGLSGQRLFLGATAGFDYGVHRYDRNDPAEMDQVSGVHLGGMRLEHDWFASALHVRTTMELRGGFSAVRAIAIDPYFRAHPDFSSLPVVARDESYYFASSATVAPAIEASSGAFSMGASGRYDTFWSLDGLDRYEEKLAHDARLHDRRTLTRVWIGVAPAEWIRARVGMEYRTRTGEVDGVAARRDETALWTSVGAVF